MHKKTRPQIPPMHTDSREERKHSSPFPSLSSFVFPLCSLCPLWLNLFLFVFPAFAESPAPPAFFAGNEELRGYLLEAAENHPLIKAHYEDWYAALAKIPQATGLEDPMFTYSQMVKSDEAYFTVALEQKLPWYGTRKLRGEAAAAEADYWLEHLYAQRNLVLSEVKKAYYEYAFLGGRTRTMEGQIGIMEVVLDIAKSKYESGFGAQPELVRIDIELTKMRDMYAEMTQMRAPLSAALARAIGRSQLDELPWPQDSEYPADPPAAEDLAKRLRDQNPSLKMFDAEILAREKEADVARKANRPEITVGADYTVDRPPRRDPRDPFAPGRLSTYRELAQVATGQMKPDVGTAIDAWDTFGYKDWMRPQVNELSVSVGVTLPIWRKKVKAGIAEKEHEAKAQAFHKEDEAQGMESMARMARFQWDDATRRLGLYHDNLVPKEQAALQSLNEGYVTGNPEANFPMLLESMRNLMQLQTEYLRAERDKHLAAAQLEFLLGAPWDTDAQP